MPHKDPIRFTFTIAIPRVNWNSPLVSKVLIPVFIILAVFVSNLPHLYADFLYHDDGYWYYLASEGFAIHKMAWRAQTDALMPYCDWIYSYSMVYLGLPLTRSIIVLIMSLSSLLLYYFYHRTLGFTSLLAVMAAVIPNILPSFYAIPVGLNSSYPVWGFFPIFASLILVARAFQKKDLSSLALLITAFILYVIGINLAHATNFLIPSVLLFFLFFIPVSKVRTLIYGLPFLLYGMWMIYLQLLHSPKKPVSVTLELVLERIRLFWEAASFLPYNQSYSLYITLGLVFLGFAGLFSMSSSLYRQPAHFNFHKNYYRLLMLLWPLCWIISTSIAYMVIRPPFDSQRYAYMFNFGATFLQSIGLAYLISLVFKFLKIEKKHNLIMILIVFCAVLFTGIQRHNSYQKKFGGNFFTLSPDIFREVLNESYCPFSTQFIILDESWNYNPHPGNYWVNSGYIRYLLQRNDISAVIGPDEYPNDVFVKFSIWMDCMVGLNPDKPVAAFRFKDYKLEPVELMLQTRSTEMEGSSRLGWVLYEINPMQPLLILASGVGMESCLDYINNHLPFEYKNADIAFAPKGIPDDFIDDAFAEVIDGMEGIVKKQYEVGKQFTIRNVIVSKDVNETCLQILLQVNEKPSSNFRLSYILDGKSIIVPLWDFALVGDNMLLTTLPVNLDKLAQGITLGFVNTGVWPHLPLEIKYGEEVMKHLILQYHI